MNILAMRITNFFYPQVLGEAGISDSIGITTLQRLAFKVIVACGAVLLLDYVHTLSAVHLALSFPFLWTMQFLQGWRATRRFPWQTFTLAGVNHMGGLSLLVISNHAFFSMVKNATHDGGISVYLGNAGILALIFVNGILFVALAVLAASNKSGLICPNFV